MLTNAGYLARIIWGLDSVLDFVEAIWPQDHGYPQIDPVPTCLRRTDRLQRIRETIEEFDLASDRELTSALACTHSELRKARRKAI